MKFVFNPQRAKETYKPLFKKRTFKALGGMIFPFILVSLVTVLLTLLHLDKLINLLIILLGLPASMLTMIAFLYFFSNFVWYYSKTHTHRTAYILANQDSIEYFYELGGGLRGGSHDYLYTIHSLTSITETDEYIIIQGTIKSQWDSPKKLKIPKVFDDQDRLKEALAKHIKG